MNEEKSVCRIDYEAECERLKRDIHDIKSCHDKEKSHLHHRIAELEQKLMIFEQKWSVIELIFGK